jgi:hypothetical protein
LDEDRKWEVRVKDGAGSILERSVNAKSGKILEEEGVEMRFVGTAWEYP